MMSFSEWRTTFCSKLASLALFLWPKVVFQNLRFFHLLWTVEVEEMEKGWVNKWEQACGRKVKIHVRQLGPVFRNYDWWLSYLICWQAALILDQSKRAGPDGEIMRGCSCCWLWVVVRNIWHDAFKWTENPSSYWQDSCWRLSVSHRFMFIGWRFLLVRFRKYNKILALINWLQMGDWATHTNRDLRICRI